MRLPRGLGSRLVALLLVLSCDVSWGAYRKDELDGRPALAALGPRNRRSLEQNRTPADDGTCAEKWAFQGALENDTHLCQFDLSGELSLMWIGDGTGIILVLTTFRVPLFVMTYTQSKLYRSNDYGKTFQDVTSLINHTYIHSEFGMAIGPDNSGKVILVADVSGGSNGGRIFRSSDSAQTFVQTDLLFHPLISVLYSPENSNFLLVLSVDFNLWISKDFGETWKEIHHSVCSAKWAAGSTIIFTIDGNNSCKADFRLMTLKRTSDFGQTFQVLRDRVHSFGLWGRFLLASVVELDGLNRKIHVSQNQGDKWNVAQLPSVTYEQFYSVLAANDDMVFIHVDDEGDTGCGTIYTSDDRGILYSKSLERHLYTTTSGETDFTNVTSLHGVFITSVLSEDNSIHSVISFDQGGEWSPLRKPENSQCDSTAKDKEQCSLHIHAQYSISQRLPVPMPPLSEPNAVGIVIAHGSVGDAVSVSRPGVYLSDDGGYSWSRVLDGPHHYAILDSGGLIVAVEQADDTVNTIKFSTDEGQCWFYYKFTNDSFIFTGLASEPGALSLNVTIWGYQPGVVHHIWMSYTIDFAHILHKACEERDYILWLAHSTDPQAPSDGCVLGCKDQYFRLRKSSVCQNGRDYTVSKVHSPCACTVDDYMCDFGYYRNENESECVEQAELKGHELDLCVYGEEEKLTTSGYRKIPGDKCTGGTQYERKEIDMKKKCLNAESIKVPTSSLVPVIISVVFVMLVAVIAVVLIIKKHVCGGRFLVHRYSVLRQNMDAQGDDPLDTDFGPPHRGSGFHDDSDEDLLE
ncbi:sortilin 1 S homeolog precursor [Xenopus laevis]|uniref:Sortilin n=2 Tax=Xenopus laevis TaxID=8355 RepID=B1H1Q9_XENLA|nr:sortilin 1 S homeolog precursor [Xenopus laevis]AAI60702.1 LOC100158281 protein [Xenopus laevis]